jgi:glucose/arabinose dehydrogenase
MKRHWFLGTVAAAALAAVPPAVDAQTLRAQLYAQGFTNPIAFVQDPSMANVQYVAQQNGLIWTIANGAISGVLFLDLSGVVSQAGGEGGLLGLAFDPNPASGRFYVNYTRPVDGYTVVTRYKRSVGNPLVADPASRFDLTWPAQGSPDRQPYIVQPFSNHNGGNLVFGPDGYLYIGLGDGGAGNDPDHRAQNEGSLLGKMLRVDVNVPDGDAEGYDIPDTNPFLSNPAVLPEIWAFGLRNPWRYSFDNGPGGTGALVLADVGQGSWEEVNYEPAGAGGRNYGWRNREGSHDNPGPFPNGNLPPYFTPLVDPIHEYDHTQGSVITGGVVYRGNNLGAAFQGRYFFADFGFSRVWSAGLTIDLFGEATVANITEHTASIGAAAQGVSHIGVDAAGEVYLVNYFTGRIHRLYLEFATNGNFSNGLTGWTTFATPDPSYFVGSVVGGVLEFYRNPPPPGQTNQAVVFQQTGVPMAASTRFAAQFDLGNSSSERKRIAVLISDVDFNDLAVCTFWIPAGAPMRTYRMFSHAIQTWSNATISFYAATAGSAGGAYRLDNVSLRPDFGVSDERTDCVDPAVPTPLGGAPGPDLIVNGSFTTGLPPWGTFGTIQSQITGGVFEFYKPSAVPPAGVVLQPTNVGFSAGTIIRAVFQLGNSSGVRKRVTVILHDLAFEDLAACTFWLPPGQPLLAYDMRTFATQAWTNATVSVYPATVGAEQWILLDNVGLQQIPGVSVLGTECIEPTTPSPGPGIAPGLWTRPARTTMPLRRTRWLNP